MFVTLIRVTLLITCVFASMLTMACGTKYNIKGRVVDAATNQAIEGASIAIRWAGQDPEAYLAPYASGNYLLEKVKTKSDKDGYFTIPKYPLAHPPSMGVYKKGYVCWSNRSIFQKGKRGLLEKGRAKKRLGFKIKNDMVIKLIPFSDEFDKPTHAAYVDSVSFHSGGLEGIEEEITIYYKYYIRK